MIKVSKQRHSFNGEDTRIIREFAPILPALSETLQLSRSSRTDPNQVHKNRFIEERTRYIARWRQADPDTRVQMAGEEEDGGHLIVRTNTYVSTMGAFKQIAGVLVEEALQFNPPVEIGLDAIYVKLYTGKIRNGMFGFEVSLPSDSGIVVPVNYTRIVQGEYTA